MVQPQTARQLPDVVQPETTPMNLRESLERRMDLTIGIAIAVLGLCLYLPYLGAFPLWDPWEPHYSQVAWEMSGHDTWLDPYYRNANNWWSKPILMLWLLRASFSLLWDSEHAFQTHELPARLPFALAAVAGAVAHFDWVRRLYGRGTGILAAVVLMSSTQYLLIGRQVMADMILVVCYANAIGYLAVGLFLENGSSKTPGNLIPILSFWSLTALAVLAKGFVPLLLTVLVLGSYAVLTYAPSDAHRSKVNRSSIVSLARRIALAILVLFAAAWATKLTFRLIVLSNEQRELCGACAAAITVALVILGVFHDTRPSRHLRQLLCRIRASWGIPLFLAIAAPWYIFMTLRHGWPYWKIFIFFHHLDRARGAIHLPTGSFDFYLRQLGFSIFPWTGLWVGGLALFIGRCHPTRSRNERRNLFILCMIAAPLAFFMISGTKFGHYVFPILPACSVITAASLIWLTETKAVESRPATERNCLPDSLSENSAEGGDNHRTQGTLAVVGLLGCLATIVLLVDIRHDYRHLLRSFIYYFNRSAPFDYQPATQFTILALPFLAVTGSFLWSRCVRRWHLTSLTLGGVAFAAYLGWVTMPAMGSTFTYKPLYDAYRSVAKPSDPVGQYCSWAQPERSVLFLFKNRVAHLNSDAVTALFLSQPGRKFILVDRNRLADLRRVAKSVRLQLHIVFADHAYARLVSTEANPAVASTATSPIVAEIPAGTTNLGAEFGGKIRLHGWRLSRERIRPGESVDVAFYWEAMGPIERNWQVLVHGDEPQRAKHRLFGDHYPARGQLPTRRWQEGRIIEDRFTLKVPRDYPHDSFFIWTGLFIREERLPLTNRAPTDGSGRVRGPLVFVEQNKP